MTDHVRRHLLGMAAEDEDWATLALRYGKRGGERNHELAAHWIARAAVCRAQAMLLEGA